MRNKFDWIEIIKAHWVPSFWRGLFCFLHSCKARISEEHSAGIGRFEAGSQNEKMGKTEQWQAFPNIFKKTGEYILF